MPRYNFSEARARTFRWAPYIYQHIANLIPVPRPGLGGITVDRHMRVYYDPDWLEQQPIDEPAAQIASGSLRLYLRHHKRCTEYLGENPTQEQLKCWDLASALVVDPMLKQMLAVGKVQHQIDPPQWQLPQSQGLQPNLSVEQYFDLLWERQQKQPKQPQPQPDPNGAPQDQQGNQPGDPHQGPPQHPGQGGTGSSADNQPKPWECDAPGEQPKDADGNPTGEPAPDGVPEHVQKILEHAVSKEIERESNNRGNLPGGLARHAQEVLQPRVDPYKELHAAVRYSVAHKRGLGDYTWRKIGRRSPPGSLRLPASHQPQPHVIVAVDTSGSMGSDDLSRALGVIALGLRSVPSECLRIVTGDTHLNVCQRVFHTSQVDFQGGGGTDMSRLLMECAELKPTPQAVIVVTDGYTGWPPSKLPMQVVACLTRNGDKSYPVPDWIRKVAV